MQSLCTASLPLILNILFIMEIIWSAPFIPTSLTKGISCFSYIVRLSCHGLCSFLELLKLLNLFFFFNFHTLGWFFVVWKYISFARGRILCIHNFSVINISFMPPPQVPVTHLFNFPTLPPNLWQPRSFTVFIVLSFSRLLYNWNQIAFSGCLLSFYGTIINGIVLLTPNANSSLLLCRNAFQFCILTS